jgi:hypothetical protein
VKTHHCPTRNATASLAFFHFRKGIKMSTNQKGSGSGSKQGSNQGSSKQSGGAGSSGSSRGSGTQGGTQGGTHEQHVEAGRQSHKNDGNKSGNR